MLRRISSQTSTLLKVWEPLIYAVKVLMEGHNYQKKIKGLDSNHLTVAPITVLGAEKFAFPC